MKILNGSEPQLSPQIADDLIVLAREFADNVVIATFGPRQDLPSHRENVRGLLPGLDRGATFEADLLSIRDSLVVLQRNMLAIRKALDSDFARILSELDKMAKKVRRPAEKRQPARQAFSEMRIE